MYSLLSVALAKERGEGERGKRIRELRKSENFDIPNSG